MKEQLKKQDMVVGKQYKGYAWRNEYGEFFFRPSAVGVLVYIRIPRCQGGPTAYIKALTGVVNKLIAAFMRYEI